MMKLEPTLSSTRRLRSARRPLFAAAVVLILGLAALLGNAAIASRSSQPASPSPQAYYLALGDSLTYGYQPNRANGAPPSAFDTGFVDVFGARLRTLSPKLQVVNYGCPGETTVTFTRGGCPAFADHMKLHDSFRGSQLKAALSFLRAHPGQVSPITVTLWGNDWFAVLLDTCKGKVACVRKHGPKAIAALGTRLTSIVKRLRTAAPGAEIVVTGAWNPDPAQLKPLKGTYRSLNASIARAAAASHAGLAKMGPAFNPPGTLRAQKARLCARTFICSKGDPHPTNAGYRAMADAFMTASGYRRK
jgi:lysophospholipase L1-like esterase